VVLARTGELCAGTGLADAALNRAVQAAVPYLSARQPHSLQAVSVPADRDWVLGGGVLYHTDTAADGCVERRCNWDPIWDCCRL
jgi:hypothetical protein